MGKKVVVDHPLYLQSGVNCDGSNLGQQKLLKAFECCDELTGRWHAGDAWERVHNKLDERAVCGVKRLVERN